MERGLIERNRKMMFLRWATVLLLLFTLGIWFSVTPATAVDRETGNLIPATFSDVAQKASPAVVNISTLKKVAGLEWRTFQQQSGPEAPFPDQRPFDGRNPFHDFFERFFGDMGKPRPHKERALGTGFIIDKSGLIITNNHVVEGAEDIVVKMSDDKEYKARILGRDPKTDLALVKIEADQDLPYLKLGDSEQVRIGDWTVAIGNPFGLSHTVTAGILSARGRVIGAGPYDDFLQTDASINPGNSGGPLLNLEGEVIGINTAIVAQGQGIGFAIPANMARNIVEQLKENGKVVRGWLGVMIQQVTPELAKAFNMDEPAGALVADVTPNGPADRAGLERGDIIIAFNGDKIKDSNDLPGLVAAAPIGKKVKMTVIRGGKEKSIKVAIGELKEEQVAASLDSPHELGLTVEELTPETAKRLGRANNDGVLITGIENDGQAGESGLKPGDVILEINRQPVKNLADYRRLTKQVDKGDNVLFLVARGNNTLFFTMSA